MTEQRGATVAGWYVTDVRHRALAGPFDNPEAPEASEAIRRLYSELGAGCCDLGLEWLDEDGTPAEPEPR